MTFEQLSTFIEVCRSKSIKKASNNLYISYQAVSRTIQKLEDKVFVSKSTIHRI